MTDDEQRSKREREDIVTIKVYIANKENEGGRLIKVETLHFDKLNRTTDKKFERDLAPGEAAEFYVHLLKDLIISEITP